MFKKKKKKHKEEQRHLVKVSKLDPVPAPSKSDPWRPRAFQRAASGLFLLWAWKQRSTPPSRSPAPTPHPSLPLWSEAKVHFFSFANRALRRGLHFAGSLQVPIQPSGLVTDTSAKTLAPPLPRSSVPITIPSHETTEAWALESERPGIKSQLQSLLATVNKFLNLSKLCSSHP